MTPVISRGAIWIFIVYVVCSIAVAQNDTQSSCSDLGTLLNYNASTTREISAYSITEDKFLGDEEDPDPVQSSNIEDDGSRRWRLSLRVHKSTLPIATLWEHDYQHSVLLDTGDSNVTRMGMCHQFIHPFSTTLGFQWKKEVMQRSLKDSGDCKTMLGDGCVDALVKHYQRAAVIQSTDGCNATNWTMPTECGEMVEPEVRGVNLTGGFYNTTWDPATTCDGINTSTTHGTEAAYGLPLDVAIRFPLLDIITFWPNHTMSPSSYVGEESGDARVELACLRADHMALNTEFPASGEDILNREGNRFLNVTEDTSFAINVMPGNARIFRWLSASAVGIALVL